MARRFRKESPFFSSDWKVRAFFMPVCKELKNVEFVRFLRGDERVKFVCIVDVDFCSGIREVPG